MNEREIFDNALALSDPVERAEYLDKVCGAEGDLRAHIEGLLTVHGKLGGFLESPAVATAEGTIDPDSTAAALVGSQIGHYKLREQIGEGGMGVVYVAEQTDPVKRKVALKVIKPGMDSRHVIARFEAERQALAMMDHPNIARVFDGGATSSGQPFFVMELVQGPPISDYCDQQRLNTRERLQLFLYVCRAVHHAHQKGIIHRDLKPTNVLVPEIDGVAIPKVIDFGVAKAIDQKLTEQTVYTQFSQMIGTPLYMSPEQAGLGVVDVDTRSDVYALGVLLYELLTGQTPFDGETLKRVGPDEMRRMIREEEPQHPSAMIDTLRGEALSTTTNNRRGDRRQLCDELRGELDWIVMKALAKNRDARYASADEMATDLQRYLDDEPVLARPVSKWYRVKKFSRRHRAWVASTAAILVTLMVGLAFATVGFLRASAEQEDNRLLIELLSDMYPKSWGHTTLGRKHTVYDSIEEISEHLEDRLRDHPVVEIKVRQVFADAYSEAREFEKVHHHLHRALQLAVQEYGEVHETVADIHAVLADEVGWSCDQLFDYSRTLEHANQALAIYSTLGRHTRNTQRATFARAYSLLLGWPERRHEAEAAQKQTVESARKFGGIREITLSDLAMLLFRQGESRLDEALEYLDEALAICGQKQAASPMTKAEVLTGQGNCLRRKGDAEDARNKFAEAWNLCQTEELRGESNNVGFALAETHFALGDVASAFTVVNQIRDLAGAEGLKDIESVSQFVEGWLLYQLEDYPSAERAFSDFMRSAKEPFGDEDKSFALACGYMALTLEAQQKQEAASEWFRRVLPITNTYVQSPYVHALPYWFHSRALLGSCGTDETQLDEALATANEGLGLARAWPWEWMEPHFQLAIAMVQHRSGNVPAAIRSLESGLAKAIEPRATLFATGNWDWPTPGVPTTRRELELTLADYYVQMQQTNDAIGLLRAGIEIRERALPAGHFQVALARLRLGEFLLEHADDKAQYEEARSELRAACEGFQESTYLDAARRRAVTGLIELSEMLGDVGP